MHCCSCRNRNVSSYWQTLPASLLQRHERRHQRVRGTFRMPARQRKRMSELLAKGNNGTLTDQESQELDVLVDQFEQKTLAMTRALTRSGTSS